MRPERSLSRALVLSALSFGLAGAAALAAAVEIPLWQRPIDAPRQTPDLPQLSVHPRNRSSWLISGSWMQDRWIAVHDRIGAPLGHFTVCARCFPPVAAADGSGWGTEYRLPVLPMADFEWFVHRYAPDGTILATIDLSAQVGWSAPVVLPDKDGLDLLELPSRASEAIRITRVAADGSPGTPRLVPLSTYAGVALDEFVRQEDGSLALLLTRDAYWVCAPLLECPDRPFSAIWLDAEGEVSARFDVDAVGYGQELGRHLDQTGRLWRLAREGVFEPYLQIVEVDGTPNAPMPLDPAPSGVLEFAGPIRGRALVLAEGGLWLYDAQGKLRAHDPGPAAAPFYLLPTPRSDFGYLLRAEGPWDASLFDPEGLQVVAHFDRDGLPAAAGASGVARGDWTILPDGWVHASLSDLEGAHLAVFAIPGTPAYRPFGSGFEARP
jgi:hypothetical protein